VNTPSYPVAGRMPGHKWNGCSRSAGARMMRSSRLEDITPGPSAIRKSPSSIGANDVTQSRRPRPTRRRDLRSCRARRGKSAARSLFIKRFDGCPAMPGSRTNSSSRDNNDDLLLADCQKMVEGYRPRIALSATIRNGIRALASHRLPRVAKRPTFGFQAPPAASHRLAPGHDKPGRNLGQ